MDSKCVRVFVYVYVQEFYTLNSMDFGRAQNIIHTDRISIHIQTFFGVIVCSFGGQNGGVERVLRQTNLPEPFS